MPSDRVDSQTFSQQSLYADVPHSSRPIRTLNPIDLEGSNIQSRCHTGLSNNAKFKALLPLEQFAALHPLSTSMSHIHDKQCLQTRFHCTLRSSNTQPLHPHRIIPLLEDLCSLCHPRRHTSPSRSLPRTVSLTPTWQSLDTSTVVLTLSEQN
jgi:hypothetical protein